MLFCGRRSRPQNNKIPLSLLKAAATWARASPGGLHRCGFRALVTETAQPTVIRSHCGLRLGGLRGGHHRDGVTARRVEDEAGIRAAWAADESSWAVDPQGEWVARLRPLAVVDAIMAKQNTGTSYHRCADCGGAGAGICRGRGLPRRCGDQPGPQPGAGHPGGDAVEPDTGVPGDVGGESARRVLRAPADGIFRSVRAIGDRVRAGEVVAYVDDTPVLSRLDGVLRGLLHDGLTVRAGVKVGDVDPQAVVAHCFTISDKALAVGGGVLEAILFLARAGPIGNRQRGHDKGHEERFGNPFVPFVHPSCPLW